MPGLLGTGSPVPLLGLPQDIEGEIAKFVELVSPSAKCMRGLYEMMAWDAEKEECENEEGFLFNFWDWRMNSVSFSPDKKRRRTQ